MKSVFFSLKFFIASHKQVMRNNSRRETAIENKQFKETKTLISNSQVVWDMRDGLRIVCGSGERWGAEFVIIIRTLGSVVFRSITRRTELSRHTGEGWGLNIQPFLRGWPRRILHTEFSQSKLYVFSAQRCPWNIKNIGGGILILNKKSHYFCRMLGGPLGMHWFS